ncbi:MAG: diguanylate cyclase, partial [Planctomycetota bacterium]|nr:diguanylate cyclase [Planctomycetota bacterium]
ETVQPQLMILDILLPGMNGFDTCRELRRRKSEAEMPIIMVTALSELKDKLHGIESGADDYLIKPINAEEVKARVRSLLRKRDFHEKLKQGYRTAVRMATTDALTGLYNHGFLYEFLNKEVARAARFKHPLSLIMADVDHFKRFNDSQGHVEGDTVLRSVGRLILGSIRSIDVAARYGGEEFVIVLPETGKSAATAMAERLRETVENHAFSQKEGGTAQKITISLGVAALGENAAAVNELVRQADAALYEAKRAGRNKVVTA